MLRFLLILWLTFSCVLHAATLLPDAVEAEGAFIPASEQSGIFTAEAVAVENVSTTEPSAFFGGDTDTVESPREDGVTPADAMEIESVQPDETLPEKADAAADDSEEGISFFGLFGSEENESVPEEAPKPVEHHLYTTLVEKPERLFKGEIFSITLRSIVTTDLFESLGYRFRGGTVTLLNEKSERTFKDHAYYDRFYFKVSEAKAVLPDITSFLTFSDSEEESANTISGADIDVVVLNPPKAFSGVLARHLEVSHVKTTVYDDKNNIVVMTVEANQSDLGDFRIRSATKQNFESLQVTPLASSMSYYAVLPDTMTSLRFSYFDLNDRRYRTVTIPIDVEEDTVSTMSDLKPVEHSHNAQKAIFFGAVALMLALLAVWKRSWLLFSAVVIAGGYAAWLGVSLKQVCVKEGAAITLLPMHNATVFEITPVRRQFEVQGEIKGYTKVRLENNKIGWVKDEDTCTH